MIRTLAFASALALGACSLAPSSLDHLSSSVGADAGPDTGAGGGAGGNSAGDAGHSGGAGGAKCFPTNDQKVCSGNCVSRDNPATGCNTSGCAPCDLPNAVAGCGPAGCAIQSCNTGFADCNNDPADGCETNINADPTNCGGCGSDCTTGSPNTSFACDNGSCVASSCAPGTGDCNPDASTPCATDLLTSVDNCGFCGNLCTLSHAKAKCTAGTCAMDSCETGFVDCDGNAANGCEVDAATDPGNCGGCGRKCAANNGVPSCSAGQCGILCASGYGNCDGDAANGCEKNLTSDVNNCGKCGATCSTSHASASCVSGSCHLSCSTGWQDCDGAASNGCEVNVYTSSVNCGACGRKCPPGYYCNLGVCDCTAVLPCAQ